MYFNLQRKYLKVNNGSNLRKVLFWEYTCRLNKKRQSKITPEMAPVLYLEVYYFTCTDMPRGLTSVLIVVNTKYTKFV